MDNASVEVAFNLGKNGWGNCRLKVEGSEFLLDSISYTTDALGDLVRAALVIAVEGDKASCSFDREPSEWRLVLERSWPSELYVRVLEFDDMIVRAPESAGIQRFNQTCRPNDFCDAVSQAAADVLRIYGVEVYQKSWGLPFPIKALAALDAART